MELDYFTLASSAVLGLSLLSNWISLGSVKWATTSYGDFHINIGLWKSCAGSVSIKELDVCVSDARFDWMKAVAAMMVIAMFASVCAVAASVLSLVFKRQKKMLLFISGGAAIAAALPILIGLHLWGIMIGTVEAFDSFRLGWSFFLAVAHCNLTLIGGSVAFIGATKTKPQHPLITQDEIADVQNSCKNAIINNI